MEDLIYCPQCGIQSSADRRFCRSCGLDLLPINQFITGKISLPDAGNPPVENISRKQKLTRQGAMLAWGGWVLSTILAILGVAMQNLDGETGQFLIVLSAIGGPLFLTGIAMLIYAKFILKERASIHSEPASRIELRGQMFSVTEGTTELFEGKKSEITRRDTAPQNQ